MSRDPTAFETRVYDAVSMIPRGKVSTYSAIAKVIGCGSSRAIGQALKRNPLASEMPCHRVVSATLRLGGFNGTSEGPDIMRKRRLLEKEGVQFDAEGAILPEYVFLEFDRSAPQETA